MSDDAGHRVVSVLTEVAAVTKPLDYRVRTTFRGPTDVGSRVRVPLHGRSVRGWILGEPTDAVSGTVLKDVTSSLGYGPPPEVVDLASWAAWRWDASASRFLTTASPKRIVARLPPRPPGASVEGPASELGALGVELAEGSGVSVVHLGPAADPIDLVLGCASSLTKANRLAEGSLVVLVPGVGYAARLASRLGRRGIPAVDLAHDWDAARAGWPVVVGTRTAAFAPVPTLAGVIVLDAEDDRYQSEAAPTWRAIDVVVERASRARCAVLAVTSCPSPALSALERHVSVSSQAIKAAWPQMVVVDRRGHDPREGWLSKELVERARVALDTTPHGVAVACVLNRKGRAKLVACRRCNEIASCSNCHAALELDDQLHCARCGLTRPVICESCGMTAVKRIRPGTKQLAEELGALLGISVQEVTASGASSIDSTVRCVLGTEAVLHRVRRARLVAFLDLDHHLLAPRAGAEVGALSLVGHAGRLVGGRGDPTSGEVLVQTSLVNHPVVTSCVTGDPSEVVDADLELRRQLDLPPFRTWAVISGPGALRYGDDLRRVGLETRVIGPDRLVAVASDARAMANALSGTPQPAERVRVGVDDNSI